MRAAIHRPSGDTVARPGTDEITRCATGRGDAVGEVVTAMVVVGEALGPSDVVGGGVPSVGVAAHADARSETATATTRFFTTSG